MMKKIETSDMQVGELVKKIQMNESKVGKVGRSARFGQEECMTLEQDAMLAEAGEENESLKCVDDISGKELPWQAVKEARGKGAVCMNLACTRRLTSEQLRQSTTSLQSTQSGLTLTEHLRESRCKSVHELVARENSKVETGQICMRGLHHWKL